jgi:hypothetical protein
MFKRQLVGCLSSVFLSHSYVRRLFFPPSTEPKFARIWTKEMLNAQLVAALPDGCSSLQEGVEFFPQVLNQY